MRLFDTRTGEVQRFIAGRTVRLYVCGITPYDAAHLGHAFTYTIFDVLARFLEHRGHRVLHVRNVTDVDDDILRRSRELGVPVDALAREETGRFAAEMAALGVRAPDAEPWASAAVPAILQAVRGLLDRGAAYALDDGRVYFDTAASDRFGRLARLDEPAMLREFAEKGGDPDAPGKRHPLDFLLWQPSAEDEPRWEAPWGAGRPGWHIECSAMAMEELGAVIDIHGGGRDLVFPHHEAEVCQSEHLTGQAPFARLWLHCGMVGYDGAKMAKSRGNLVFIGDLLERYEAGAVRRYLLEHHYRSDWAYEETALDEAAAAYKTWQDAAVGEATDAGIAEEFHAALSDDLDTPRAVRALDAARDRGAGATLRELAALLGFSLTP